MRKPVEFVPVKCQQHRLLELDDGAYNLPECRSCGWLRRRKHAIPIHANCIVPQGSCWHHRAADTLRQFGLGV